MVKRTRKNDNLMPQVRRAASLGLVFKNGWYVLPSRGGVVTGELIEKAQEEVDREDAICAEFPRDAE